MIDYIDNFLYVVRIKLRAFRNCSFGVRNINIWVKPGRGSGLLNIFRGLRSNLHRLVRVYFSLPELRSRD